MYNDEFLEVKLQKRIESHSLRRLQVSTAAVDFCSNDYLGLARAKTLATEGPWRHGSGGARTLYGNYPLIETLEAELARFHQAEAALLFNSGYAANLGLMSSVPQRSDTILYDYLAHASLRDGIRLSNAEAFSFLHNDLNDLEKKLAKAKGRVFVVTESVFSMDGDRAPLADMLLICEKFGAHLVVDEAHATGVTGPGGAGCVQSLGLPDRFFARIHTFGKAVGAHGAAVLGSERLKSYLVNFARAFVFTTALPESAVAAIRNGYAQFPGMDAEREQLSRLITRIQTAALPFTTLPGDTPIQAIVIPGNERVRGVAALLQQHGLDVRPILYPTVPEGLERLRVSLHSFNTISETDQLITLLREAGEKP